MEKEAPAFEPIQEIVTKTDKFIFVIPEYNGSFPGVLKVFIDACSFPESFYEKKAALWVYHQVNMAISGGLIILPGFAIICICM